MSTMFGRKRREDDLRRELQNHLDMEAEEYGDPNAARRALGNVALIQESTRESWGMMWLDRLAADVRYACRAFRRSPGFSAVVVLTAALGIGANTSIFSIVNSVLLHPLPYRDPGRLVQPVPIAKDSILGLGVGDFQYAAWRDQAIVFDGIAAFTSREFTITGSGEPERVRAGVVTPGFLRLLGMQPAVGRDFVASDAAPRGGQVALIGYRMWQQRFGGDRSVMYKSMTLDGKPSSIAGVLPAGFEFPANRDVDVLIAMAEPPLAANTNAIYFYNVIARLKRGVTPQRAESDLALLNQRLAAAYPKKFNSTRAGAHTFVHPLHDHLVGDVRLPLLALAGAVLLVLLIVCVNIANLLLARAIVRQKEMAVRIALGAGRGRVVRQLLTEGMLLAAAGGAAGLALAFAGVKLLRAIAPADVPHVQEAHISGVVLAFTAALSLLSGILFGLAPLRAAAAADPEAALKQSTRAASGDRRHRRLEGLLVVAETAFALVLLAGAGLLIRTFAGLTSIPTGFQPERVLTSTYSLPYWKYRGAGRQQAFIGALVDRVKSGPGVTAAGAVGVLPYGGFSMTSSLEVEGRPKPDPNSADSESVTWNCAAGDYFQAMGIPVLEGRTIDSRDTADRPSIAVINEKLARRFFPNGHAIGARVRLGGVTQWMAIVGVVGDVKQQGLASETRPQIIQPVMQSESGGSAHTLVVRSSADARVLIPWVRAQMAQLEPDLPAPEFETMREVMASKISSQYFVMRLLGLFAAIAVMLAAIGIYSVLAYSVERRSLEIGIRMALGARRAHIMALILGRGLRLALSGAALGIAGGLALTRYLKSLLYGVTPHDPVTLAAGCGLMVAVALAAAYLPARRAVGQDTAATLRAE